MNIQDEVQKIHARYGITEKANYEIQKVCETYAKLQIEKDRERICKLLPLGALDLHSDIKDTP